MALGRKKNIHNIASNYYINRSLTYTLGLALMAILVIEITKIDNIIQIYRQVYDHFKLAIFNY